MPEFLVFQVLVFDYVVHLALFSSLEKNFTDWSLFHRVAETKLFQILAKVIT